MAADQNSRRDLDDLSTLSASDPDVAADVRRQPARCAAERDQVATFRDDRFGPEVMPSPPSAPARKPKSR